MRDVIEVICMLACFIVPFVVFQQWAWMYFFIAIGILFALAEGYFALLDKERKTLTRRFREFRHTNTVQGWLCAGSLVVGWGILMVHLLRG